MIISVARLISQECLAGPESDMDAAESAQSHS